MTRLTRRRLPIDLYNRCVTFLWGTVEQINAQLKRECPRDFEPLRTSCRGHWKSYLHRGYENDFICIVKVGAREDQLIILAHEALHCASHALRMAGLAHTEETEEAYTYYQQYLMRMCAQHLREHRR